MMWMGKVPVCFKVVNEDTRLLIYGKIRLKTVKTLFQMRIMFCHKQFLYSERI